MKAENFGAAFLDVDLPFPCEIHFSYYYAGSQPGRYKVLLLFTEPEAIRISEADLAACHSHFDLIMTHDKRHLGYPSARYFPFNDPWVRELPNIKRFEVSTILSTGCRLPTVLGYHQRVELANRRRELDFPTRYYISNKFPGKEQTGLPTLIDDKKDCLFESMFHIAIENGAEPDYCTEKLLDCFMTYTVPIYIGFPNLHEYFNPDAIIRARDVDDIIRIVNGLSLRDYYERLSALQENRAKVGDPAPFLEQVRSLILKCKAEQL